ncbi:MAG: rhodanese-like domain-containing protein [Limnochordia bacterium]
MYVPKKDKPAAAYRLSGQADRQASEEPLEAIGSVSNLTQSPWLGHKALLLVGLLIVTSFVLIACAKTTAVSEEVDWTAQQLADKLAAGDAFRLIDVREPDEYMAGHIPGAELMPLGRLTEYLDQLKPDEVIAVICRSGNRSQQAVRLLKQHGYTRVHNVTGGMSAWRGPVEIRSGQ